jgi:hypothetical protein
VKTSPGMAAMVLIAAAMLAGCGDKHPTAPGEPVTLERSAARTATIGIGGGSVSATASDGTHYTLEIPPGALRSPQEITITPIRSIRDSGISGGLAGAVELKPSGLRFGRPATLRIRTSKSPPAGTRRLGFTASSDFTERTLAPAAAEGGELAMTVFHFSAWGVGFFTAADIRNGFWTVPPTSLKGLISQVLSLGLPWDVAARAQAEQLAQQAFQQIVLPGLQNADAEAALLPAISDYWDWRDLLAVIAGNGQEPELQSEAYPASFQASIDQAKAPAAAALGRAIDAHLEVCSRQPGIQVIKNIFFWHERAWEFEVASAEWGMEPVWNRIEARCARIVLMESNWPPDLTLGVASQLDLHFALEWVANNTRERSDFNVSLNARDGATIAPESGETGIGDAQNPLGFFTTAITPTDTYVRIGVGACLWLSDRVPPQPDPDPWFTILCINRSLFLTACVGSTRSAARAAGARRVSAARSDVTARDDEICEEPPPPPPPPPPPTLDVGEVYVGTRRFQDAGNEFPAALFFNQTKTRATVCQGQTFAVDELSRFCGTLMNAFGDETAYQVFSIDFTGAEFQGEQIGGADDAPPDSRITIRGTLEGDSLTARLSFPGGLFNTYRMTRR